MASQSSQPDLIVIGAGPAGSALAISAAKTGFSVLIVEKSAFPRHRPGESLHPGAEPILRQLGVWNEVESAGFLRNPGIRNHWGGTEQYAAFSNKQASDWQGIQAVRSRFDTILLEKALAFPQVELIQSKALSPVVSSHKVTGVNTQQGTFEAPYVLDASGMHQWLGRRLKLPVKTASPPLRVYYGYVRGTCQTVQDDPLLRSDEAGWYWLAKLGTGHYTWTHLPFSSEALPKSWLPNEYAGLEPEGPAHSADVSWRIVQPCAGPGYYLLGDAGFVLDPTSSHGVLKAMMSGIKAAHLITHTRTGKISPRKAAWIYHDWMATWFEKEVKTMRTMYQQMAKPPAWCSMD